MRQNNILAALLLFLLLATGNLAAQENITAKTILGWSKLGAGSCIPFQEGILIKESDSSNGFMLLSSANFPQRYTMNFNMVALTSSTVMIVVLQAADTGINKSLHIPAGYDGSMNLWNTAKNSYFLAFRNAPHASVPFISKQPGVDMVKAKTADDMLPGKNYQVEVGVDGSQVWLKVDGKKLIEYTDPSPYGAGRFAFRIRGLPGLPAACLLTEFKLTTL